MRFWLAFFGTLFFCHLQASEEKFSLVSQRGNELKINFELGDYQLHARHKIVMAGSEESAACEETPALPSFSKLIVFPYEHAVLTHNLKKSRTYHNVEQITAEEKTVAYCLTGPFKMRGRQVYRLTINPFRYEDRTITALEAVEFQLKGEGYLPATQLWSQEFTDFAQGLALNGESNPSSDPGSYLFVYNGSSNGEILSFFAEWKRQKGHVVYMLDASQINGGVLNTTNVKQAILSAYQTHPDIEYLLLAGDATGSYSIPCFMPYYDGYPVASDYPYCQLDGDDIFPDVFVGRFSFSTTTELFTIINKTMVYEKNTYQDDSFFNNGLLVADPSQSGYATINDTEYIASLGREYNPELQYAKIYSFPYLQPMLEALNSGVGTYFYRGFENISGFGLSQLSYLTNTYKTPFMSLITCHTGGFADNNVSMMEAVVRLGTPNSPRGAVAAVGSSSLTHTSFNNIITCGMAWGMYKEGISALGALLCRGKFALYENYPQNPHQYVDWFTEGKNLMGDPGLNIILQQPKPLQITFTDSLFGGATCVRGLLTSQNGEPAAKVRVTLQSGENIFNTISNADGSFALYFPALPASQPAYFTCTSPRYKTKQIIYNNENYADFTLEVPIQSLLAGTSTVLPLRFKNLSEITKSGSILLSSPSELLSLEQNTFTFTQLAAGDYIAINVPVHVSPAAHNNDKAVLNAVCGGVDLSCELTIGGASIELVNTQSTGFRPAADGLLTFTIKNTGVIPLDGGTLTLSSPDNLTTIAEPQVSFSSLAADSTFTSTINVHLSPYAIGGQKLKFALMLSTTAGYHNYSEFTVTTEQAGIGDPTGPDDYGYVIYHSNDAYPHNLNAYNWIDSEQSPYCTSIPLDPGNPMEPGDTQQIPLPFAMRFYGEEYTSLYVCSNGFVTMGEFVSSEFMNWQIPGPLCPKPIIAPFWDALLLGNGSVSSAYFPELHCFVITWDNLLNRYDLSPETFQLVIYDPAYYATNLGDSILKFQYKVFHNTDAGEYLGDEAIHGEYASIGIGSHTGLNGICYSYADIYPESAQEITSESALLIADNLQQKTTADLFIAALQLSGGNNNNYFDAGENLTMTLTLKNVGTLTAEDISAVLISEDENISVSGATVSYGNLFAGETSSGQYQVSIAVTCQNNWLGKLKLAITYNGQTAIRKIPVVVYAPEAVYLGYKITDENNNQLEQGETGNITLTFKKNSYLTLESFRLQLSSLTSNVGITPLEATLSAVTDSIFSLSFNIVNNANNGSKLEIPFSYQVGLQEKQGKIEDFLGTFSPLLSEDFSTEPDDLFWQFGYPVTLNSTNYCGGDNNELAIGIPAGNNAEVYTAGYSPQNIGKYRIEFKWANRGGTNYYGFRAKTGSLSEILWQDWEERENQSVSLDYFPTTTSTISFAWFLNRSFNENEQLFYLDDIKIYTLLRTQEAGDNQDQPAYKDKFSVYPNPFNPLTTLSFYNQHEGYVKICVYNLKGRFCETVVDTYLKAGENKILWQPQKNLALGVYFLQIKMPSKTMVKKVVLLK